MLKLCEVLIQWFDGEMPLAAGLHVLTAAYPAIIAPLAGGWMLLTRTFSCAQVK